MLNIWAALGPCALYRLNFLIFPVFRTAAVNLIAFCPADLLPGQRYLWLALIFRRYSRHLRQYNLCLHHRAVLSILHASIAFCPKCPDFGTIRIILGICRRIRTQNLFEQCVLFCLCIILIQQISLCPFHLFPCKGNAFFSGFHGSGQLHLLIKCTVIRFWGLLWIISFCQQ